MKTLRNNVSKKHRHKNKPAYLPIRTAESTQPIAETTTNSTVSGGNGNTVDGDDNLQLSSAPAQDMTSLQVSARLKQFSSIFCQIT